MKCPRNNILLLRSWPSSYIQDLTRVYDQVLHLCVTVVTALHITTNTGY